MNRPECKSRILDVFLLFRFWPKRPVFLEIPDGRHVRNFSTEITMNGERVVFSRIKANNIPRNQSSIIKDEPAVVDVSSNIGDHIKMYYVFVVFIVPLLSFEELSTPNYDLKSVDNRLVQQKNSGTCFDENFVYISEHQLSILCHQRIFTTLKKQPKDKLKSKHLKNCVKRFVIAPTGHQRFSADLQPKKCCLGMTSPLLAPDIPEIIGSFQSINRSINQSIKQFLDELILKLTAYFFSWQFGLEHNKMIWPSLWTWENIAV